MNSNWQEIAHRDRHLRIAAEGASSALARYRYEHTTEAGVTFREYARRCGVSEYAVRKYATAWEAMRSSESQLTISDALVRASTSSERADVIEVVAAARDVSMKTIQAHHGDEVRRIETIARERAATKGTTVRDEAATLARVAERQRTAEAEQRAVRRERGDLRFMELEKHLLIARRALGNAMAVDVELDDEHRALILKTIGTIRELLGLVELRFIGAANVDFDAELVRLIDGEES